MSLEDVAPPGPALCEIQQVWDDSICGMRVKALPEGSVESGSARLLASGDSSSCSWLNSLPTATLGLRL